MAGLGAARTATPRCSDDTVGALERIARVCDQWIGPIPKGLKDRVQLVDNPGEERSAASQA
jgi:hypothetical protein